MNKTRWDKIRNYIKKGTVTNWASGIHNSRRILKKAWTHRKSARGQNGENETKIIRNTYRKRNVEEIGKYISNIILVYLFFDLSFIFFYFFSTSFRGTKIEAKTRFWQQFLIFLTLYLTSFWHLSDVRWVFFWHRFDIIWHFL